VYVFSNSGPAATILYPSPSTITVTASTGYSRAYLYTNLGGTGHFDLGTTTSYSLIDDPVSIPAAGTAWLVYDNWGPPPLQPDTLYHWRFRFVGSNSQTYLGPDQTFRTLPDGQVTVGNGTPGNCTTPDFEAALPTAKSIKFNCGALPITLTLTSPHLITSNLTIDGGNKVTLDAGGAGPHFDVQAGFALTLTAITLVDGNSTSGCGGSINVAGSARLTLSQARLLNNQSNNQGGALCIETGGSASIADSLFRDNRSTNHGGAIGNYGAVTISGTKFISNSSSLNGGAIDTTVFAAITGTTFLSNTSGWRGGGINNYLGLLKVTNTSFISNKTSGFYGGGLANDSNGTLVTGSTFFDNHTAGWGGAIESSGTLTVTNSTVSANRSQLEGGGIFWVPSAATTLTLLNDTVVSNTAGTHGGNIYAGGVMTAPIDVMNTLVAFGSPNNCDNPVHSLGNNLENTNVCGFSLGSDQRGANPKIGPLQDNGGPTLTHALKPGSPAIDKGTNSGCPGTDQRGNARPQDGDGNGTAVCDIGAFEAAPGAAFFELYLPFVRR
jgi:predicted outer membrane repeat protein